MPLPTPHPGLVIRYAYLWRHEHERSREEGVKDRPCAVVLVSEERPDGGVVVTVAPVTHVRPSDPEDGVEIPLPTKRRLGLDERPSWVIIDEVNRFVWPGPDLRPVSRREPSRFAFGTLPPKLFGELRGRLVALYRRRRLKIVPRSE